MSTLKVNKLRDTAGSADAITLDPNGGAVLAGVTTMTTARVYLWYCHKYIYSWVQELRYLNQVSKHQALDITCASINGAQIGGLKKSCH